jgi:glycosyltransferase involved in cell wall biosynthesis
MAAQSAASDGAPPRRGDEEIRQPYVVMVSTFYSYKNHRRLIKAFAQLIKEHRLPHRLVLAGGDGDVTRTELEHTARRVGVADRVSFTGPIKHGAVPALLKGADAVAYVSECETFGHPVVEALAMGRPLVTSAVASMPEIAGNAAVLVDPFNVESIARGLAMALLDMELRDRLAYDGPRRAATFTWSRCAEETAAVLQFAVERPKRGPTHA